MESGGQPAASGGADLRARDEPPPKRSRLKVTREPAVEGGDVILPGPSDLVPIPGGEGEGPGDQDWDAGSRNRTPKQSTETEAGGDRRIQAAAVEIRGPTLRRGQVRGGMQEAGIGER